MSPITTHILDTSRGAPAQGVGVRLERASGDDWAPVGDGTTDGDGRVTDLLDEGALSTGRYRITFAVGAYHAAHGVDGFYPEVSVVFEVRDATQHYHVPLLLNPFGFSTYRGS